MPYQWTLECAEAFRQLKKALIQAPVLTYPCYEEDFLLETDASGVGWELSYHNVRKTTQFDN